MSGRFFSPARAGRRSALILPPARESVKGEGSQWKNNIDGMSFVVLSGMIATSKDVLA
jgi:hypothetical protein